jgi:hypothetical protein
VARVGVALTAESETPRDDAPLAAHSEPGIMNRDMTSMPEDGDTLFEDLRLNDWSIFRSAHPHALLIGSEASAQAMIARLLRYLRAPLVHWRPGSGTEPPHTAGTLVIWDVRALDRMQQAQLLAWMDRHIDDGQVISIAPAPVFPLALREEFLDALYYRLNIVCLGVDGRFDGSVS